MGNIKHINKNNGYDKCTGCHVCTLCCPVFQQTHDNVLTVFGRARALQGGASVKDLEESIVACILCGACEPACPFEIDTVNSTISIRSELANENDSQLVEQILKKNTLKFPATSENKNSSYFLAGNILKANKALFSKTLELLNQDSKILTVENDGSELIKMIEAGLQPTGEQKEQFLKQFKGAKKLIVSDGLLQRFLKKWLPKIKIFSLGETLLNNSSIRSALKPSDMYIIETRGFNSDFKRQVKLYDKLRKETGCLLNLDLQRIAIPTGAACIQKQLDSNSIDPEKQIRWILEGHNPERIICENTEDMKPFQQAIQLKVIHVSELV